MKQTVEKLPEHKTPYKPPEKLHDITVMGQPFMNEAVMTGHGTNLGNNPQRIILPFDQNMNPESIADLVLQVSKSALGWKAKKEAQSLYEIYNGHNIIVDPLVKRSKKLYVGHRPYNKRLFAVIRQDATNKEMVNLEKALQQRCWWGFTTTSYGY